MEGPWGAGEGKKKAGREKRRSGAVDQKSSVVAGVGGRGRKRQKEYEWLEAG